MQKWINQIGQVDWQYFKTAWFLATTSIVIVALVIYVKLAMKRSREMEGQAWMD